MIIRTSNINTSSIMSGRGKGGKTTNTKAKRGEASSDVPGGSIPKAKAQVDPAKEEKRMAMLDKVDSAMIHSRHISIEYGHLLPVTEQQRFEADIKKFDSILAKIFNKL